MLRKVLLTGSTGMLGRNLLEDARSKKFSLLTPDSKELDLLNFNLVDDYVKFHQPDFIIHAAGKIGGIRANIEEPVKFLIDNLEIGKNVILSAKKNGVQNLLNIGSSCMYPKDAINPLREDLVLKGELEPTNEGYALAKITLTRLCEYISREEPFFRYKTIIPSNLYGRYDKFDPKYSHMIPAVIKKIHDARFRNQENVEIWGDGTARREFMYVGDLVDFIFFAMEIFERMPQNLNVGIGVDYSINDYYHIISGVVDFKGGFVHDLTRPVGMMQKLMDNSMVLSLGWKPQVDLEMGIKIVYDYFLKTYSHEV